MKWFTDMTLQKLKERRDDRHNAQFYTHRWTAFNWSFSSTEFISWSAMHSQTRHTQVGNSINEGTRRILILLLHLMWSLKPGFVRFLSMFDRCICIFGSVFVYASQCITIQVTMLCNTWDPQTSFQTQVLGFKFESHLLGFCNSQTRV